MALALRKLRTLQKVVWGLGSEKEAREYFKSMRWRKGLQCLYCRHSNVYLLKGGKTFKCSKCKMRFSLTTRTIFENSKLSIQTWMFALAYLCEHGGRVGSTELSDRLGISQKSAWYVLDKLQAAAKTASFRKPLTDHSAINRNSAEPLFQNPGHIFSNSVDYADNAAVEAVLLKLHKVRSAFGWGHPSDANRTERLFSPLLNQGNKVNARACYRWAIEHGWDNSSASELRQVIRKIFANQ